MMTFTMEAFPSKKFGILLRVNGKFFYGCEDKVEMAKIALSFAITFKKFAVITMNEYLQEIVG